MCAEPPRTMNAKPHGARMKPEEVGKSYDAIAERWNDDGFARENGMEAHRRAIAFVERAPQD